MTARPPTSSHPAAPAPAGRSAALRHQLLDAAMQAHAAGRPAGRSAALRHQLPGSPAKALPHPHSAGLARPATLRLALRKPVPKPILPTSSATLRIAGASGKTAPCDATMCYSLNTSFAIGGSIRDMEQQQRRGTGKSMVENKHTIRKSAAGLDSFEEAQQVIAPVREADHYESASGEGYVVTPLVKSDDEGNLKKSDGSLLYLHYRYKWNWDFFSYSSDCWAWVTDAIKGGAPVRVDRLEAHLTHKACFGRHSKSANNASRVHAYFRITGIAVCKTGITAWACLENTNYGRFCTKKGSA